MCTQLLLVDLAVAPGRLELFDNQNGKYKKAFLANSVRHARDLIPQIDQLFQDSQVSIRHLAGVAVILGPGGYTGLRVSLTFAKTLAFANNLPLFTIPTFDAYLPSAAQVNQDCFAFALDALKGEVFGQAILPNSDKTAFTHHLPLAIYKREDFLAALPEKTLLIADALTKETWQLPNAERAGEVITDFTKKEILPSLANQLGAHAFLCKDIDSIEPLYLRGSYAEVAREKAK